MGLLACTTEPGSVAALLSFRTSSTTNIIMSAERTFIAVKPDGVQRGLIGEIIKRFEQKGFKMCGMKFMQASEEHMKKHYEDLADKPFYPGLVKYMSSALKLAEISSMVMTPLNPPTKNLLSGSNLRNSSAGPRATTAGSTSKPKEEERIMKLNYGSSIKCYLSFKFLECNTK